MKIHLKAIHELYSTKYGAGGLAISQAAEQTYIHGILIHESKFVNTI